MLPELSRALAALHKLAERLPIADEESARIAGLAALSGLVDALPAAHSPRVSLLRWALLRVHQALRVLTEARSLTDVAGLKGGQSSVAELSEASLALAQLVAGARRRLQPSAQVRSPQVAGLVLEVGAALDRAVAARDTSLLAGPIEELASCLKTELPEFFSGLMLQILGAAQHLPLLPPRTPTAPRARLDNPMSAPPLEGRGLPPWMPLSRMLGGFYVLWPIGEGGSGSVFVARRAEQRSDSRAETFALKVPEYDGTVSQLLSEADFLRLFREEASALLALPDSNPNLARFVTFDAGVRPKPILVMEHVQGPSLEKVLTRRNLDLGRAFAILSGIARGLNAMHRAGLAHLDIKPSNVIVRDHGETTPVPVLVDFGLAGRRLRPGCGTANYAAPEVWGQSAETTEADPRCSDVYAFGCLAYEVLTGSMLFEGDSDRAVISAHLAHDGKPLPLLQLLARPTTRALGEVLTRCLRQRGAARATIGEIASLLPQVHASCAGESWPLAFR